MRTKKMWLGVMVVVLVLGFSVVQAEASASYQIDAIYDDVNTANWLTTTPTFTGGQTYDITVEGSGDVGVVDLGDWGTYYYYAEDTVNMGLFIKEDPALWIIDFTSENVISGQDTWGGNWDDDHKTYSIDGLVTAPDDLETGTGEALAWLSPYIDHEHPWTAYWASGAATMPVNFQAAVPEPGSISLLSFGLLGLLGRFRKRA